MATCLIYGKSCESLKEVATGSVQLVATSFPDIVPEFPDPGVDMSSSMMYNRALIVSQALPFLRKLLPEIERVLKDDGVLVVDIGSAPHRREVGGFGQLLPLVLAEHVMLNTSLSFRNTFVIVQTPTGGGEVRGFKSDIARGIITVHEFLLVFARSSRPKVLGEAPSVWLYQANAEIKAGPAPFSPAVVAKMLSLFTEPGDLALDPCAGLGTLWAVARELGRNCIMYEVDADCLEFMRKAFPDAVISTL